MSDRVEASGAVHWIGTGLSTGSGVALLCDRAEQVTLWGRTALKAEECLDRLGLTGKAAVGAAEPATLAAAVGPGDVVVSMLPATEHAALLRLCLARGAHFACSSYTSPELSQAGGQARGKGLAVLTEAGLDPGIDHVLAHALVARAAKAVGDVPARAWFTSYCGGVPAVADEFRYRFSWAPRGVLSALCAPATYLESGVEHTVARPWEATRAYRLDGEAFEVYPNRDSRPFVRQYDLPAGWVPQTFVRGTLRLDGWHAAWQPVFDVLRTGDGERIDALAADLLARYPMRDGDRDRVVLAVELTVEADDGTRCNLRYLLDLVGDERQSAMARAVSVPLAFGVTAILDGSTPAGMHRALPDPSAAEPFIEALRGQGLDCRLTT
jgi:saccharopine dehydrogenase-like NADP-dependent oxidoreductase